MPQCSNLNEQNKTEEVEDGILLTAPNAGAPTNLREHGN
jgi:hypothetical protein